SDGEFVDTVVYCAPVASRITSVTLKGSSSMATWQVLNVVVRACIRVAMDASRPGGIDRSRLAKMYQLGFVFHAGAADVAARDPIDVGPCVAARISRSFEERHCAKSSSTPTESIVKNPEGSTERWSPSGAGVG